MLGSGVQGVCVKRGFVEPWFALRSVLHGSEVTEITGLVFASSRSLMPSLLAEMAVRARCGVGQPGVSPDSAISWLCSLARYFLLVKCGQ